MPIKIKRFQKKGQESIGMSFNMIFSIFIIIVIIAIAVVVLVKFLGPAKCMDIGFFYNDLQDAIDKGRAGDDISFAYDGEIKNSGALKSSVSFVCFGNLTSSVAQNSRDENIRRNISRYNRNSKNNVFMYPPDNVCEELRSYKLENVRIENFFCIGAKEDKGKIKILLESEDGNPVRITRR